MQLSSTTQRKNKITPLSNTTSLQDESSVSESLLEKPVKRPSINQPRQIIASVKRRKFGTQPFDENWLNLDCCGLFFACFTYSLHLYGCYVVCFIVLPPWFSITENSVRKMTFLGLVHSIIFTFIASLACYSHFKAMTTDPGAVPPDAEPFVDPMVALEEEKKSVMNDDTADGSGSKSGMDNGAPRRVGKRLCRRCNSFKPKRAHHCSICRRCIVKMDHHCPWVNNCVGIGNHKFFLLFVFYTSLSCLYSMTLIVWRFFQCTVSVSNERCLDNPTQLLHYLGLSVESFLFGLFTCCMMIDQWSVVTTNITTIDRLKGELHLNFDDETRTKSSVNEVFGGECGFQRHWLSPFTNVTFPSSMRNEIMGYCRPCIRSSNNKNGPQIV